MDFSQMLERPRRLRGNPLIRSMVRETRISKSSLIYGGRRDVMSVISPRGSVYQAGTLSGNPVAMAAGLTQLMILRDTPAVYQKISALGDFFRQEMGKMAAQTGVPVTVTGVGSLSCIFFTPNLYRR